MSIVPGPVRAFAAERHIGIMGTLRPDGSPHLVPVGFTLDPHADLLRVITFEPSQKVANAERRSVASVSWVDGGRWATLEGPSRVVRDADGIRRAVEAYGAKYRAPGERANRVAIEITVERVSCSRPLREDT